MKITTVEGRDLAEIVRTLTRLSEAGRLTSMRISQEHGTGTVKVSINQGCWSLPMGVDTTGK